VRLTNQPRDAPQFYLTAPQPCPYLPGQEERKVFTHLVGKKAPELNEALSHGGFRRSQTIAYRPACDACRACVSVRVIVDEFMPSRNLKRVAALNSDLIGAERENRASSEQYSLFRRYLEARHPDGGMVDMSVLDYAMMVEDSHVRTNLIEYRRKGPDSRIGRKGIGPLAAIALTDVLSDGLSMVYSFFDPALADRSLGTFMVLDHVARARRLGLRYLYLGYWIENSRKMAYKARFQPQERLSPTGWIRSIP
jgi:arginine-tRNA-protein transferase